MAFIKRRAGEILDSADEVWATGEMIVKVKEPIEPEYPRMREGQLLFTYLHLAPDKELTGRTSQTQSYRHRLRNNHRSPRRPAVADSDVGSCRPHGNPGWRPLPREDEWRPRHFAGRCPGVPAARVVIIGGGVVGTNAAKIAVGMGAHVTIIDNNLDRLRELDDIFLSKISTLASSAYMIHDAISQADLIVGAVLVPGASAPRLVTRSMLKDVPNGAVIVDVAVDQGGCIETTHPTTHSDPTYYVEGVLHYCVANMPGAVPRTSTFALTNATLPYALKLANRGILRGDCAAMRD